MIANQQRNVMITGATGALGKMLVQAFIAAGHQVLAVGRDLNALLALKESLNREDQPHLYPILGDLSAPDSAEHIMREASQFTTNIDILINNAAIHGPIGAFESSCSKLWNETLQVNLLAPVALTGLVIPAMKQRCFGRIINLSGGGAAGPRPNFSAYAATKTALVRFTETVATELFETGVTLNAIAPGAMKTKLLEEVVAAGINVAGEHEFSIARKVCSEGGASMEKVIHLALFLASPASAGITGKLISAQWDDYEAWVQHLEELQQGDLYTLRRITGRDRGQTWGDK